MDIAVQVGMNISEFWQITPYELGVFIKAHNKREQQANESRLVAAYLCAAWQRSKRMPSLDKILGRKPEKPTQMKPADMLQEIKKLNVAFGGSTY